VRRDNCQLVRTVVSTCLEMILIHEDEEGAKEYVRNTISDLLMNRLDLSLLVITKVRMASPLSAVNWRRGCCYCHCHLLLPDL
jgi:DNA polymerase delta subunit 1